MKNNLPFASLRTFESVVRLRGFGRAAEELGVSQSAVSQHVKALEKWLGARLVRRSGGVVIPTDAGQRLATTVGDSFGRVASLCNNLRASTGRRAAITLACPAGLAQAWLMPRLAGFDQAHPDIPLSLRVTGSAPGLADESADLVIHYGPSSLPGLHCERLMSERIFPVCAPTLLEGGRALHRPADLAGHTILHEDLSGLGGNAPGWDFWARQTGTTLPRPLRERTFNDATLIVSASVAGFGVGMGREAMVMETLTQGRLVRPFDGFAISEFSYWLTCLSGALTATPVSTLRDWLHEIAAQRSDLPPPRQAGA